MIALQLIAVLGRENRISNGLDGLFIYLQRRRQQQLVQGKEAPSPSVWGGNLRPDLAVIIADEGVGEEAPSRVQVWIKSSKHGRETRIHYETEEGY